MQRLLGIGLAALLAAGALAASSPAQTWEPARRLNDAAELEVKEPKLASAANGGVWAHYRRAVPAPWAVQVRRFDGTNLGPVRTAHTLGFLAGGDILESGDGSLWVTWENWAPNNEQIWTAQSWDEGRTWQKWQVTQFVGPPDGQAKNPQLVQFGLAEYGWVMSSNWRAPPGNHLFFNLFDTKNWWINSPTGITTDNSYAAWGVAQSPVDGNVYRTYGRRINNVWQLCLRRFNLETWLWESEVVVSTNTGTAFVARPAIAINDWGQILIIWDQDNTIQGRFWDGERWHPQVRVNAANHPALCAIPGSTDFYAVYCTPQNRSLLGKPFIGKEARWGLAVDVTVGLPQAFTINPDVAADEDGNIYAAWEYWGNNRPQAYYSVLRAPQ